MLVKEALTVLNDFCKEHTFCENCPFEDYQEGCLVRDIPNQYDKPGKALERLEKSQC